MQFCLHSFFSRPCSQQPHIYGTKPKEKRRRMKIDPLNQLFLTLVKLRLNVREREIWHTDLEFQLELCQSTSLPGFVSCTILSGIFLGCPQWSK